MLNFNKTTLSVAGMILFIMLSVFYLMNGKNESGNSFLTSDATELKTYINNRFKLKFSYPAKYYVDVWISDNNGGYEDGGEDSNVRLINEGVSFNQKEVISINIVELSSLPLNLSEACKEADYGESGTLIDCLGGKTNENKALRPNQEKVNELKGVLEDALIGSNPVEFSEGGNIYGEVVASKNGKAFIEAKKIYFKDDYGAYAIVFSLMTFTKNGDLLNLFIDPQELVSPENSPNDRVLNYSAKDAKNSGYWKLLVQLAQSYENF